MFRKQKGQGMTEFALVLPLLLLLLLGVIEAARVIWAFITVQSAAREATRYAVTGRPYLDSNDSVTNQRKICLGNPDNAPQFEEPDPISSSGIAPWLCKSDPTEPPPAAEYPHHMRVEAIKKIALSHLGNLAYSTVCDTPSSYFGSCSQQPGAIGVLVEGQTTIDTISGTQIVSPTAVLDFPGDEGLNVQISTFYNLEMITPVYDTVMGGNFIRLQGRTQLQNEGLDAATGIEPPPPINPPEPPEDSGGGGVPTVASIEALNYNLSQSDSLSVRLKNHDDTLGYDIYLNDGTTTYLVCTNVLIGVGGEGTASCPLLSATPPVPPGLYTLYSTAVGGDGSPAATALQEVEVIFGGNPVITVDGGNVWAANETTKVNLQFHLSTLAPYTVKLLDPDGNDIVIWTTGADGLPSEFNWTVPDLATLGFTVCDLDSGKTCTIQSIDKDGDVAATLAFNVNQPSIDLSPETNTAFHPYPRGATVKITLRGHTPGQRYDVFIIPVNIPPPNTPPATVYLSSSSDVNSQGDLPVPFAWPIPAGCGLGSGWPDGEYQVVSRPQGGGPDLALRDFEILGPNPDSPTLTVSENPVLAGSSLDIFVLEHLKNQKHYLEFNGNRIPTAETDNTFTTGSCGDWIESYVIPPTTPAGDYTIASYNNDNDVQQTVITITVISQPTITVLQGDKVLPNETITIQVASHQPNTSYDIFYADRILNTIVTDLNGFRTFTYDLKGLPSTPYPIVYGVAYNLYSQPISNTTRTATTTLTLQSADLVVTKVDVAPSVPFSTTVPVTLTVQNAQAVTINQIVDIDLYMLQHPQPDPVAPSYLAGYNFPGDVKFWKNGIGANETFLLTHNFTADELGSLTIYGYADTSNTVFESELPGQVANPNNINSAPLAVSCSSGSFIDNFTGGTAAGWVTKAYGNAGSISTSAAGNELNLTGTGSSTWVSNDDTSGGELYFHRSETYTSSLGLDVQVKVTHVDLAGSYSKAGLEIRNSLSGDSPRVTFGVARNNGDTSDPRQVIQAGYRNTGQSMSWVQSDSFWMNNYQVDVVDPGDTPVWLRVERDPGTNGTFRFYIKQTNLPPPAVTDDAAQATYWGSPANTVQVSGIGDQVYVGLFNSSYSFSSSTSRLDDFSIAIADPAACPQANQTDFPPGFQACTEMLDDLSFEAFTQQEHWKWNPFNGVTRPTSGGNFGNNYLQASTTDGGLNPETPEFWQAFTMPDFILSDTTTIDLSFYHQINTQGFGEAGDEFYVTVRTTNNPGTGTQLTTPKLVANGANNINTWQKKSLQLAAAPGINLENYKGQNLYLYFDNTSNVAPPASCNGGAEGNICRTDFSFDDMSLQVCTTQPKPANITTRLTGKVTLNFSNGTTQALPYVKVWAYAQSGQAHETFTIQGGEFNFYNLPVGQYTIFAQYNLVQGTQVETLAADTSVILNSSHTATKPAQAFLNLFTLQPPPSP